MTTTIFLQKDTKFATKLNGNANIILSPQFYWVRVFDIPIASKKEAMSVVPNLFEDFFDVDDYKFYIIKLENNQYLSFAYKEQDILDGLKNANISLKKVSNIYFAQNEFVEVAKEQAILINEQKYFYQDNIFIQIPSNMFKMIEANSCDVSTISLSKNKISINQSSKYIDRTSAYILSTIFIFFSLAIFFKTYTINKDIQQYPIKINKLKKDYNLMSSMIQTKSVLKGYKKVSQNYDRLRTLLQYTINFKKTISGKLENIEIKQGIVYGYFTNTTLENMKQYFEKKYTITHSSIDNNITKIGIKL
jgi:hypothetical protein